MPVIISFIGFGIITNIEIQPGNFILEYVGEKLDTKEEYLRRTKEYNESNSGSYIYEFKYQSKRFW